MAKKGQNDKQWSTKHYTEYYSSGNMKSTKTGSNSGASDGRAVPVPHVAPVVLLLLQPRWQVMNEDI
jgi:hypothetical protein